MPLCWRPRQQGKVLIHPRSLFTGSLEMWGGATFDVALRFLHECPWCVCLFVCVHAYECMLRVYVCARVHILHPWMHVPVKEPLSSLSLSSLAYLPALLSKLAGTTFPIDTPPSLPAHCLPAAAPACVDLTPLPHQFCNPPHHLTLLTPPPQEAP